MAQVTRCPVITQLIKLFPNMTEGWLHFHLKLSRSRSQCEGSWSRPWVKSLTSFPLCMYPVRSAVLFLDMSFSNVSLVVPFFPP